MKNALSPITELWGEQDIDQAIKRIANEINDAYGQNEIVNLIPILTGALLFSAKLIIELEILSPGKWKVIPIMSSSYFNTYESTEPDIIMVRDFEKRLNMNSPCLVIDDILDSDIAKNIKGILTG